MIRLRGKFLTHRRHRRRGGGVEARGVGNIDVNDDYYDDDDDDDDDDDGGEGLDGWCDGLAYASEADYYRMPWYDGDDDDARRENGHDGDRTDVGNGIERGNGVGFATSIIPRGRGPIEYDDIFDMRRRKLLVLKQMMDAMPRRIKILRMAEFDLNPDVLVRDLIKEYGLSLSDEYMPLPPRIDPIRGRHVDDNDASLTCMEYSKWKEAMQRIDWNLEGYFGHNRFDCRLCRDSDGQRMSSTNDNIMKNDMPIGGPPTSIYLLGERNSGTTFVSNTLAMAFDPPNTMGSKNEKFSIDVPVLLHKHMFRHDLLDDGELREIRSRGDILWIMVVRPPCDCLFTIVRFPVYLLRAEAMYRKPYHFCPPKKPEMCGPGSDPNKKLWLNQNFVAGMSLQDFFEIEWSDWAESVPFLRDQGSHGAPIGKVVSISKVSANYTYPNVFRLRKRKLEIMKQIVEAVPRNVKFVHLNELERSPEMFIQGLVGEFNLTVRDGYEPQSPSKVVHTTVCLTPEEWDSAQNNIDWKIEAEFGFSPFECRMCHGYEKSISFYNRWKEGKKVKGLVDVNKKS
ncbi:hypothetical protein ACHAXA_000194 [Cyclostephanos tholiformis]|uniref:Sulfotransferase domain-containing protein n=1 Tax=Cyclostephanos tholiformis TaxID=382380 RepID=A0ABD3RVL5_9STRA